MIDFVQSIIQPILADYLTWAILGAAMWFLRFLPARWRVDIEARHRQALHQAIETGIGLVIDTLQKDPRVAVPDAAVTRVIGYVTGSVPDALRRLAPSQEQLQHMVVSKITQRLDAAAGRDRLAGALRQAGA